MISNKNKIKQYEKKLRDRKSSKVVIDDSKDFSKKIIEDNIKLAKKPIIDIKEEKYIENLDEDDDDDYDDDYDDDDDDNNKTNITNQGINSNINNFPLMGMFLLLGTALSIGFFVISEFNNINNNTTLDDNTITVLSNFSTLPAMLIAIFIVIVLHQILFRRDYL